MNPTNGNAAAVDPTPPRSSFSCDRHPIEQFSTFCPACLCERLTTLDNNSCSNTPSSSKRPSSVSIAIKSLFSSSKESTPSSFFPELRRSKSYSASKNEALGISFEPQRKSCDVRVRSTLSSLVTLNSDKRAGNGVNYDNKPSSDLAYASCSSNRKVQSSIKIESFVANKPVFEVPEIIEDGIVALDENDDEDDEIKPAQDSNFIEVEVRSNEIVEEVEDEIKRVPDSHLVEVEVKSNEIEEEEEGNVSDLKPMKDHIELDSQEKKSSGDGGLRAAASVFSKKWHKWRRKQKIKKQNNGEKFASLSMEKQVARRYRETQSEVADYGFGRRSYDIDPRFSLDAGRISFDDPRYSVEEPRASWDGYMIGRNFTRMAPMVSVMEDAPPTHKLRNDVQVPVEESTLNRVDGDENEPGGSTQTREYYSDSSSITRKSLDRSSSVRKTAAAVINDLNLVSDTKVSPTKIYSFQNEKVLVGERDSRNSNPNSLRDDHSETFELDNGLRDDCNSVLGFGARKESRKSRRWSWRIWDFIHRRYVGNKNGDGDENYSRVNGVERSLSESWQHSRREGNGDLGGEFNRSVLRSNSSVSWRNANNIGRSFDETNENGKSKDKFLLEKNRSGRDSSNRVDNGLLGFYFTPLRSSRRVGLDKLKSNNSLSIARSVLKLY